MHKERGYRGYKAGGTKKRPRERDASHASGAPRAFRSMLRKLRGRERMFNPVFDGRHAFYWCSQRELRQRYASRGQDFRRGRICVRPPVSFSLHNRLIALKSN